MEELTLITSNPGKIEEASRYLGMHIKHQSLDLDEIQSLDLEEIVKDKATRAFEKVGKPVLVEDVSFTIHTFGKLPGPFIKWFEKELGLDGLCKLAEGGDSACTATVCYGLHDGEGVTIFTGSMSGKVASSPRGENSFGWGSIFVPDGYDKTYAELTNEEQSTIAMRKIALAKVKEFLEGKL